MIDTLLHLYHPWGIFSEMWKVCEDLPEMKLENVWHWSSMPHNKKLSFISYTINAVLWLDLANKVCTTSHYHVQKAHQQCRVGEKKKGARWKASFQSLMHLSAPKCQHVWSSVRRHVVPMWQHWHTEGASYSRDGTWIWCTGCPAKPVVACHLCPRARVQPTFA